MVRHVERNLMQEVKGCHNENEEDEGQFVFTGQKK